MGYTTQYKDIMNRGENSRNLDPSGDPACRHPLGNIQNIITTVSEVSIVECSHPSYIQKCVEMTVKDTERKKIEKHFGKTLAHVGDQANARYVAIRHRLRNDPALQRNR